MIGIEIDSLQANVEESRLAGQVRLAREGAEVEALDTAVQELKTILQGLEKRVALMLQRRSQYAPLFTENPDPRLRVNERIEDLIRRFIAQGQ
jgi:hypothetical protein